MEDLEQELGFQIGQLLAPILSGFVLGCVPLLIADHKGQRKLGFAALLICTGAGLQFEIVGALAACAICVLVVFLTKPKETPTE
jgi:hypothetical protein